MVNRIAFPISFFVFVVCLFAQVFVASGQEPSKNSLARDNADSAEAKLIESLMQAQTDCWNRGDIEGFMQTYWKDDRMTFSSGGETRRGWQATLDRYRTSYPREKMGQLTFDKNEVQLLGSDVALVLGNWHLDLNGSQKDGNFSLVLRKIDGDWKIVHDHSSVTPEKSQE